MIAIALHGADAAVHDYHAGRAGSFAEAMAALADARARGDAVEVATAVTRSSYRVLAPLPPLLHAHGVAAWRLTLASFAVDGADRLVPRLAMALPHALHAIDRATRLGIAATIAGAPLCLLGPLADRAAALAPAPGAGVSAGSEASKRLATPRSYPAPCDRCAARPRCPGVEARYVERFGAGELTPQ